MSYHKNNWNNKSYYHHQHGYGDGQRNSNNGRNSHSTYNKFNNRGGHRNRYWNHNMYMQNGNRPDDINRSLGMDRSYSPPSWHQSRKRNTSSDRSNRNKTSSDDHKSISQESRRSRDSRDSSNKSKATKTETSSKNDEVMIIEAEKITIDLTTSSEKTWRSPRPSISEKLYPSCPLVNIIKKPPPDELINSNQMDTSSDAVLNSIVIVPATNEIETTETSIITTPSTSVQSQKSVEPEQNAEQVTRKLINQLTNMEIHNLKQMINNPNTKYETVLQSQARKKIREEMRKQLRNMTLDQNSTLVQTMFEPDEYIDSEKIPDSVFEEIQRVLDIDLLSNTTFTEDNEDYNNSSIVLNKNLGLKLEPCADDLLLRAEQILMDESFMPEQSPNSSPILSTTGTILSSNEKCFKLIDECGDDMEMNIESPGLKKDDNPTNNNMDMEPVTGDLSDLIGSVIESTATECDIEKNLFDDQPISIPSPILAVPIPTSECPSPILTVPITPSECPSPILAVPSEYPPSKDFDMESENSNERIANNKDDDNLLLTESPRQKDVMDFCEMTNNSIATSVGTADSSASSSEKSSATKKSSNFQNIKIDLLTKCKNLESIKATAAAKRASKSESETYERDNIIHTAKRKKRKKSKRRKEHSDEEKGDDTQLLKKRREELLLKIELIDKDEQMITVITPDRANEQEIINNIVNSNHTQGLANTDILNLIQCKQEVIEDDSPPVIINPIVMEEPVEQTSVCKVIGTSEIDSNQTTDSSKILPESTSKSPEYVEIESIDCVIRAGTQVIEVGNTLEIKDNIQNDVIANVAVDLIEKDEPVEPLVTGQTPECSTQPTDDENKIIIDTNKMDEIKKIVIDAELAAVEKPLAMLEIPIKNDNQSNGTDSKTSHQSREHRDTRKDKIVAIEKLISSKGKANKKLQSCDMFNSNEFKKSKIEPKSIKKEVRSKSRSSDLSTSSKHDISSSNNVKKIDSSNKASGDVNHQVHASSILHNSKKTNDKSQSQSQTQNLTSTQKCKSKKPYNKLDENGSKSDTVPSSTSSIVRDRSSRMATTVRHASKNSTPSIEESNGVKDFGITEPNKETSTKQKSDVDSKVHEHTSRVTRSTDVTDNRKESEGYRQHAIKYTSPAQSTSSDPLGLQSIVCTTDGGIDSLALGLLSSNERPRLWRSPGEKKCIEPISLNDTSNSSEMFEKLLDSNLNESINRFKLFINDSGAEDGDFTRLYARIDEINRELSEATANKYKIINSINELDRKKQTIEQTMNDLQSERLLLIGALCAPRQEVNKLGTVNDLVRKLVDIPSAKVVTEPQVKINSESSVAMKRPHREQIKPDKRHKKRRVDEITNSGELLNSSEKVDDSKIDEMLTGKLVNKLSTSSSIIQPHMPRSNSRRESRRGEKKCASKSTLKIKISKPRRLTRSTRSNKSEELNSSLLNKSNESTGVELNEKLLKMNPTVKGRCIVKMNRIDIGPYMKKSLKAALRKHSVASVSHAFKSECMDNSSPIVTDSVNSKTLCSSEEESFVGFTMDGQFYGHEPNIVFVKICKEHVVASSDKGIIYKFLLSTRNVVDTFTRHTKTVPHFAIDTTNMTVISISLDGYINIFDFNDFKSITFSMDANEPLQTIELYKESCYIGSRTGTIRKINHKTKVIDEQFYCSVENSVMAIVGTREGARDILVVSSKNSPLTIRDAATGLYLKSIFVASKITIYSLLLHRNNLYCGTNKNEVIAIDFNTGKEIIRQSCSSGVICLKLLQNKVLIAGSYDGKFNFYNIDNKCSFIDQTSAPGKMLLSYDIYEKKIIASSSDRLANNRLNNTLRLWDLPSTIIEQQIP